MYCVVICESMATRAFSIDVGNDRPRFGLVKVIGQFGKACLADTEVATIIIVNSIVGDRSADSAQVAYVVQIGDSLEIEGVADGAPFLRAGRRTTAYTVELLALSTVGPA
jgi:hypothetical protein